MSAIRDQNHFIGRNVMSRSGEKIGKAADVMVDEKSNAWLRVDQGLFHTRHTLVPLHGVHARDGQVVVPFDKETVRNAPRLTLPVALDGEVKYTLRGYYRGQGAPLLPRI